MRVGFIGTGRHASTSVYPALRPAGLELVATCARTLEHAESAATAFGARKAFDDVGRFLRDGGMDAVAVVVPPDQYLEVVSQCIEAGFPVFAEKPGAASAEEGRQLAALSERQRVPVMVGFMKRFGSGYRRAREIATDPDFGGIHLASFKFVVGPMKLSFLDYVVENACHPLDLARFLVGELTELEAFRTGSAEARHALGVVARAQSGAVVTFELGTMGAWFQHNERMELYGNGHSVCVDNVDTVIHRPSEGPAHVWRPNYTVPLPPNFSASTMGFVPELEHFRAVVVDGVACESDIASASASLELADRIGTMARSNSVRAEQVNA